MTTGTWRARAALALTLALAVAAAGCSQLRSDTQRRAEADPGGGIGGTGISAEPSRTVGLLGTVRGFGSIRVNGVRVRAPGGFPVATPFGERTVGDLETGHVVEISARADGDAPIARRIARLVALVGPVEAVRPDARSVTVMGVPVAVPEGASIEGRAGLAGLERGTRVAVSGLWRKGGLVASRIEPAAGALPALGDRPAATALVTGVVRAEPDGGHRVGPLPVRRVDGEALRPGRFATLLGDYRDGRLIVRRVRAGHPALPPRIGRLSVEAYAGEVDGRPALHGLGLAVAEGTRLERLLGRRGVFIGPLDGRFAVQHGVPLPESLDAQRDALDALGDGLRPQRGVIETR